MHDRDGCSLGLPRYKFVRILLGSCLQWAGFDYQLPLLGLLCGIAGLSLGAPRTSLPLFCREKKQYRLIHNRNMARIQDECGRTRPGELATAASLAVARFWCDNLRGTVTLATDGTQSVWRRDSMTECTHAQAAGCALQRSVASPCRSFGG